MQLDPARLDDYTSVVTLLNVTNRAATLDLPSPGYYRAKVCAVSVIGLTGESSCAVSDGVLYETSPPIPGELCVGTSQGASCGQTEPSSSHIFAFGVAPEANTRDLVVPSAEVRLAWKGFYDPESALSHFSWALGTAPFSSDLHGWANAGLSRSARAPTAARGTASPTVYFGVRCTNQAGLTTEASYKLLMDTTPPHISAGALHVAGTPSQIDPDKRLYPPTGETSLGLVEISATLDAISDDSGIHEVAIQVVAMDNWKVVRTVRFDHSSGGRQTLLFKPKPHVLYAAELLATNKVGLRAMAVSSPFMHDSTPPTVGVFSICKDDGRQVVQRLQTTSGNHTLRLCLSGYLASQSGISAFQVHLAHVTGGSSSFIEEKELPVNGMIPMQLVRNYSSGPLPCGRVDVTVKARNGCKMASEERTQSLLIVCETPQVDLVTFTTRNDLQEPQPDMEAVCVVRGGVLAPLATWRASVSVGGGVLQAYQYALVPPDTQASNANSSSKVDITWSSVGLMRTVPIDITQLAAPRYHLHVRACTSPGTCREASSAQPLLIASSPPTAVSVMIVSSSTGHHAHPSRLNASWSSFVDPTEDVVALQLEACIGTTPYGCQTFPFVTISAGSTSWQSPELPKQCGATFYVTLRATNCAGLQRVVASEGSTLCCNAPTVGSVELVDSTGMMVTTLGNLSDSDITITWPGITEVCSGMQAYTAVLKLDGTTVWASGTLGGSESAVTIAAGNATQLGEADRIEVIVTGKSGAGVSSITSRTYLVDSTPPEAPALSMRTSGAGAWTADASRAWCVASHEDMLDVRWSATDGHGSGIAKYEFKWASTSFVPPPVDEDDEWRNVGLTTSLRLPLGSTAAAHYFQVRACDKVGLCSTSGQSAAVVRLTNEPSGGELHVSPLVNRSSEAATVRLHLNFLASSFAPHGCPEVCGVAPCFYDPTCSTAAPRRLGGRGCNAAGIGRNCRKCSLDTKEQELDACPPTPAVVPSFAAQLRFEACVGTSPYGCQETPFSPISVGPTTPGTGGDSISWESPKLLESCGVFYTTVRATNCAGLQRLTSVASQVCCDAPTVGSVQLLGADGGAIAELANSTEAAEIRWFGVVDKCGSVTEYQVELSRAGGSSGGSPLWSHSSNNSAVAFPVHEALEWTGSFVITVRATSDSGLISEFASVRFFICTAHILQDDVLVRRWGMPGYIIGGGNWSVVGVDQAESDEIGSGVGSGDVGSGDSGSGDSGSGDVGSRLTSLPSVCVRAAVDMDPIEVDLSGLHSKDGSPLLYTVSLTSPNVSLTPLKDSRRSVMTLTHADVSHSHTAYVRARGCTLCGKCAESAFTLSFVSTPPMIGSPVLLEAPHVPTASRVLSVTITDPMSSIEMLEACVGTTPYACQTFPFVTISADSTSWQSPELPKQCGATFYVTLRATNCAGLQRVVASEGSTLCCNAPTVGSVELVDSTGTPISFLGSSAYPYTYTGINSSVIRWSGFREPCSGTANYTVQLRTTVDNVIIWSKTLSSSISSAEIPAGLTLWGTELAISVQATSIVGFTSKAARTAVAIDVSPPFSGRLYTGPTFGVDTACQNELQPFRLSWEGLSDPDSGIAAIDWAIGTKPFATDIKPFGLIQDGALGSKVRSWSPETTLPLGTVAYHTVRVTNRAGLSNATFSSGVRVIASNCSSSLSCLAKLNSPSLDHSTTATAPAREPSRRLGEGIGHPLFAMAALALLPGWHAPGASMTRLEYDVQSVEELPRAGVYTTKMRVQLTRFGVDKEGSQLVQLMVGKGATTVDQQGKPADLSTSFPLHRFPILYWQSRDGQIISIHHHPRESRKALQSKRQLMSYHQFTLPTETEGLPMAKRWESAAWQSFETSTSGRAAVDYSSSRGLMGRQVLRKRALFTEPTPDRPEQLQQTSNVTTIIDRRTGFVRHLSSEAMVTFTDRKGPIHCIQPMQRPMQQPHAICHEHVHTLLCMWL